MNNITARFQDFLRNDPKAKQKIAVIAGFVILLIVVVLIIFGLNSSPSSSSNNSSSVSSRSKVTTKNFEDAKKLTKINQKTLGNGIFEASKNIYFDDGLRLVYQNQDIPNSPFFDVSSIFDLPSGLIINEKYSTTVFDSATQKFTQITGNYTSVTPLADYFLYLQSGKTAINISRSSNQNLQNSQGVGTIFPKIKFNFAEIKIIKNAPVVLIYESSERSGKVEIWSQNGQKFENRLTLESVLSLSQSSDNLIFTKNIGNQETPIYEQNLVDFDAFKVQRLDLDSELRSKNIFGNIIASRCSFAPGKVFCPIKESLAFADSFADNDVIMEYDLSSKKINFPYDGVFISIKNLVWQKDNLYAVSQETRDLYLLK